MGDDAFFEGVEKLMEIWFPKSLKEGEPGDARAITRQQWEKILESVNCKILDEVQHEGHTAYLLSESSLFVSQHRIILKTCGTTLCLQALPLILELAKGVCGFETISDFFYSRKNFMKPDRQPHMHKSFQAEIEFLDKIIEGFSAAYCLGRLNGDCWFLYTLNNIPNEIYHGIKSPDQTLELLMMDLDQNEMQKFRKFDENGGVKCPVRFTKESGIAGIFFGSKVSAEFFDPCGYSVNGLLGKDLYWTIHVTPEPEFSYVSFETNVPKENYSDVLANILKIFKPGRFTMTIFVNYLSIVDCSVWEDRSGPHIHGYRCDDRQVAQLKDYSLFYTNYKKGEIS